ncbi:MAG TPA: glycosyltransferase family 2 protein [Rhodopila sp.]|jgi:hypothetical protein|nr:glycosyltransferase family 2 protein [Rhodopila sp.]
MPRYRFALVACARWEEIVIQEWVAYHRSIGFDHIYLYSNDDDPEPLFRAVAPWVMGPDPFITFRHWPVVGQQMEMYLHFLDTFKPETEWFSFLDIDEFFVFKRNNNVAAFMRDYIGSVDCLYFNWLGYGNCGRLQRASGQTLLSYVRHASSLDVHTKHLCRSAALDAGAIRRGYLSGCGAFHHFLDNYLLDGLRCADVLGMPMDGYASNFPDTAFPFVNRSGFNEAAMNRAYVAHFQFRSEEDFLRRWRRGGFDNGDVMRRLFEDGTYKAVLARDDAVYDPYLAAYWWHIIAPAMRRSVQLPYGAPPFANVAFLKPSFQSSVYDPGDHPEPSMARVMDSANNGVRTGTYGFHTEFEPTPWWSVDLLSPHRIAEIHIYNRLDNTLVLHRSAPLRIEASSDNVHWMMLLDRTGREQFGDDGKPLTVRVEQRQTFRFVRLSLTTSDYFHLDEIEIYGEPAN